GDREASLPLAQDERPQPRRSEHDAPQERKVSATDELKRCQVGIVRTIGHAPIPPSFVIDAAIPGRPRASHFATAPRTATKRRRGQRLFRSLPGFFARPHFRSIVAAPPLDSFNRSEFSQPRAAAPPFRYAPQKTSVTDR